MNREFEGIFLPLDNAIENKEVRLLFQDSWYWLHYRFFNCRDTVCTENSTTLRAHLYNLCAMLYQGFEELTDESKDHESQMNSTIHELVSIAEYSNEFPVCLWIHGDNESKLFLEEKLAALPPIEHIQAVLDLPHIQRMESEVLGYAKADEKAALKRFRNEQATFNKRRKAASRVN